MISVITGTRLALYLQITVEEVNFFLDLLHLLSMFGLDMLPYKFRPFELFARERTQPFVLAELLRVCLKCKEF